MAKPRRYAAGRNVPIADPTALAELLRAEIDRRHGGSVALAARDQSIPRSLLRRIIAGKQRFVRADNLELLRAFAGRQARNVDDTVVSERAKTRLARYDHWLSVTATRARVGILKPSVDPLEFQTRSSANGHRMEFSRLMAVLRRRFAAEWKPLERAVTRRHYRTRAELAFARVIAPLLDWYDTAGIERWPSEFTDRELRAFIKAGVLRERLLLDRPADVRRAQLGADLTPESTATGDYWTTAFPFAPWSGPEFDLEGNLLMDPGPGGDAT